MMTKPSDLIFDPKRREFLRRSFAGLGWMMAGGVLSRCSTEGGAMSNIANLGPLEGPDENGLLLPAGFSSRIIARSGQAVGDTGYVWHNAPDGGAVFPTGDGGWIYVSNSETLPQVGGGCSAVRFAANGDVVDAYRILSDTLLNCAGGPTPWGTWLSCEENPQGQVWE